MGTGANAKPNPPKSPYVEAGVLGSADATQRNGKPLRGSGRNRPLQKASCEQLKTEQSKMTKDKEPKKLISAAEVLRRVNMPQTALKRLHNVVIPDAIFGHVALYDPLRIGQIEAELMAAAGRAVTL
jgi:hypothetical protein